MQHILKNILNDTKFPEGIAWNRILFETGTPIISKGDISQTFFYIESGVVRVLGDVELDEKRSFKPGFCDLNSGDVFGETCLYASNIQTTSVQAISPSSLLAINAQRLNIYLDAHPVQGYLFCRELFQIMMQRLNLANTRIENLLAWGLKVHDIDKHLN